MPIYRKHIKKISKGDYISNLIAEEKKNEQKKQQTAVKKKLTADKEVK